MPTENPEFEHPGKKISVRNLDALEKRLGVCLPDDYRSFLLTIDGGRPRKRDTFRIGKHNASLLDVLYSVRHEDEEYTLERMRLVFDDRIPEDLLPIGEDQGGSQICLGIGKENYGKVFFWDMEYEDEQPTYDNVYPIADSFGEFLDSLYSSEVE